MRREIAGLFHRPLLQSAKWLLRTYELFYEGHTRKHKHLSLPVSSVFPELQLKHSTPFLLGFYDLKVVIYPASATTSVSHEMQIQLQLSCWLGICNHWSIRIHSSDLKSSRHYWANGLLQKMRNTTSSSQFTERTGHPDGTRYMIPVGCIFSQLPASAADLHPKRGWMSIASDSPRVHMAYSRKRAVSNKC